MKIILLVTVVIFLTLPGRISAQEENLDKEIIAGDYRVQLFANSSGFFNGSIQIFDKYNNSLFYADSCYTGYNWDTLADLDGDGTKELILDLGTGATMYDYNMFLIFDFKVNPLWPLEIHNAELSNLDPLPKILSYVRLSPAVMGAGYIYCMKYKDRSVILEKDPESKTLSSLKPSDEDDQYFVDEYDASFDPCEEGSHVMNYFQSNLMQWKIVGKESNGLKFFDKHYKCKDKKTAKEELKRSVDEIYRYLDDPKNYEFSDDGF